MEAAIRAALQECCNPRAAPGQAEHRISAPIETQPRSYFLEELVIGMRHRLGQIDVAARRNSYHGVAHDDPFLQGGQSHEWLDRRARFETGEKAIFWFTMERMRPLVGSTASTEPFSCPKASTAMLRTTGSSLATTSSFAGSTYWTSSVLVMMTRGSFPKCRWGNANKGEAQNRDGLLKSWDRSHMAKIRCGNALARGPRLSLSNCAAPAQLNYPCIFHLCTARRNWSGVQLWRPAALAVASLDAAADATSRAPAAAIPYKSGTLVSEARTGC